MVESITNALRDSLPAELVVFIVSMLPLVELRGGLIAAALLNISWGKAFLICFLGNMLPIPFILLFLKKIFALLRKIKAFDRFMAFLDRKVEKGSATVNKYKIWGLFILVAIPLPGTGAWTGTLAASLLDMDFKSSVLACMGGVLLAGVIMALASTGVLGAFGALAA